MIEVQQELFGPIFPLLRLLAGAKVAVGLLELKCCLRGTAAE